MTPQGKTPKSAEQDFWSRARKPRFQNKQTKFLVIGSDYFLLKELVDACTRCGILCRRLELPDTSVSSQSFIEELLKETLLFAPDALLTVNHSGIDNKGVLMGLLEKLHLPLISWFLDNPHLVLADYEGLTSPYLHIFTWDKDTIASLKKEGFENTYYLPLGTDATRFASACAKSATGNVKFVMHDISFVGTSMLYRVEKYWKRAKLPTLLLDDYLAFGASFRLSSERSIKKYIHEDVAMCGQEKAYASHKKNVAAKNSFSHANVILNEGVTSNFIPDTCTQHERLSKQSIAQSARFLPLIKWYENIAHKEEKLAFEIGLIWEATRVYRLECVRAILPFKPCIVGDDGWKKMFNVDQEKHLFTWHAPLDYYVQLAEFYPCSVINLNCTAMQMKGATNQRVLDVPASGAFVLTDFREQLSELFEENEIVTYKNIEELPDLVRFYLKHDKERERVVKAGQKRVLACHTWEHRVMHLVEIMKKHYKNG